MCGAGNLWFKRFTLSISDKTLLKHELIENGEAFSFRRLNGIFADLVAILGLLPTIDTITLVLMANRGENAASTLPGLTLTQGN